MRYGMPMNILSRTVSGLVLAVVLLALSTLHFLWAAGNPFPAASLDELQRTVVLGSEFPPQWLTVLVALALLAAGLVALLRTADLNRARGQRSRLLRLAAYALGAVFAIRALAGFALGILWIADGAPADAPFNAADLAVFSPLCAVLAVAALVLAGRPQVPTDLFAHTVRLFRRNSFVHLVTLGPDGAPRTRVLQRLAVDDNGTVWMSTDINSTKVAEIRADPRVALSIYDARAQASASLEGIASIHTDPDLVAKYWVAPLRLYFSRGRRDERLALISIAPSSFGLLDFSSDVAPAPFGLRGVAQPVPQG